MDKRATRLDNNKPGSLKPNRAGTRASYNRMSKWYDLLAGESEKYMIKVGLDLLRVQEGETILEIGPGTGRGVLALAQAAGASGKVHGIDLSDGMLQVCNASLVRADLSKRENLPAAMRFLYHMRANILTPSL
jgi:ubiquinone/menaquinone biosynthesis C-methylase UbiE